MPLGDYLHRLETRLRSLAEKPAQGDRQPIALAHQILEAVEAQVRGWDAPGRLVMTVWAPSEAAQETLRQAFSGDVSLADEVQARLREHGLARAGVELVYEPDADALPGLDDRGFALTWIPQRSARLTVGSESTAAERPMRLVVEEGEAAPGVLDLTGRTLVFLGRLADVTTADGHVTRRNDVAFLDTDHEANRTVSRAHARLTREPDGWRLHDDGSARGTAVYRAGRTGLIPVRRRGLLLEPGDLLYLGQARLRFEPASDGASEG